MRPVSTNSVLLALAVMLLHVLALASATAVADQPVTCGSSIKLLHTQTKGQLHSMDIKYNTGSMQQVVTAYPGTAGLGSGPGPHPGSYWLVEGPLGRACPRGTPVPCGSQIRLKHALTSTRLHSHLHRSPISSTQEVSAFAHPSLPEGDSGDVWVVECSVKHKFWPRDQIVRLMHHDTGSFLASNARYQYGHPIPGQMEVSATTSKNNDLHWMATEGIYIPPN
ncbi:hypothetical protein H696_03654 [Fonticula alba]|uniref:MIR domain-containing protein n=1 Tax=Fonticula alba TaxID=691883 RepID=A0A058Z7U8_FONAL|nr:hypothetical protein H696_03654 [Fonticula alba]KCV70196.1 hypothetical protein H696_03654 [Fonticula alba]|eukprot:XP_009495802.1 hypothetical protein H696_03654 [Fonticula alba]